MAPRKNKLDRTHDKPKSVLDVTFKIEKNIPVPEKTRLRLEFPLLSMEVGDSFFIPNKPGYGIFSVNSRIKEIHDDPKNRRVFVNKLIYEGNRLVGKRIWRKI